MFRKLVVLILLVGCADADTGALWTLQEINGRAVDVPITIDVADGSISGKGPCNAYSARQPLPLPWFEVGPIVATKAACEHLGLEQDYFATLSLVRLAEFGNTVLVLSDAGNTTLLRYSK